MGVAMKSKIALWKAQVAEYPRSVRMSVQDMYEWCDTATTVEDMLSRYRQISMAMQYPSYVFYRIEGTTFMGFRFGTDGCEYMSLYGQERTVV